MTSINELWNPAYKGRVGMMSDIQDLGNFGLLKLGIDPETSTPADWQAAAKVLTQQRHAGLVRGYYQQSYIDELVAGNTWISMAWSGDIFQQNLSSGTDLRFVIPDEGGTLWTDNMMIPKYAQNPVDAMMLMDWYYRPQIAAQLTESINYISAVPAAQPIIAAARGQGHRQQPGAAARGGHQRAGLAVRRGLQAAVQLRRRERQAAGRSMSRSSIRLVMPELDGRPSACRPAAGRRMRPRWRPSRCATPARSATGWTSRTPRRRGPPLRGAATADLAVVGGGFTGLWTALLAKERDPARDVVLLEGRRSAWAASGRNGGFCSASLTHGLANGLDRFGAEMPALDRLGRREPGRDRRRRGPVLDRLRVRADRRADGGHPRTGSWPAWPARPRPRRAPGRATRCCWTRPRCGPRSTRPPIWAGCGTGTAAPCSTRPGWPGACAGPAWTPGCGSTSTRR